MEKTDSNDPNYEVRYLINGEEDSAEITASSAAEANELAKQQATSSSTDDYELIQVHLHEENKEASDN